MSWLKDLQEKVHRPPCPVELMVTNGSQDGLCKTFEMSLDPEGEPVALEDFVFPGVLSLLNPFNPAYMPVQSDGEGMIPARSVKFIKEKKNYFKFSIQRTSNPGFIFVQHLRGF